MAPAVAAQYQVLGAEYQVHHQRIAQLTLFE
jgi:hypothetical protein